MRSAGSETKKASDCEVKNFLKFVFNNQVISF